MKLWLVGLSCLLVASPGEGRSQVVIDAGRHHLGTAGRPEWQEFAGAVPEGRALEMRFETRAGTGEATLLIRQCDVKLAWDVRLNGRVIGQLQRMEAALVHSLAVPAGVLRDGPNLLIIGPPPEDDDVIIEGVVLDPCPVREALGRARLEVRVNEAASDAGLPCRITVVDDRGALAPLVVEPASRLAARAGVVYTPAGRALIGLPPGRYTVSATRGFEYGLDTREVTLAEGEDRRVDLAIRREVPTEGLVACDTHVHTLTYSGHGDATLDERAVTLAGEGIELPIATDHEHLTTDLAAAADRMGVRYYFTPVVGDEVTTKVGHFNAFPFPAGAMPPDPKPTEWHVLLRSIRSAPGERVVVLNHPRGLHAGFRPFDAEHFNPVTGEHRRGPLGVDALEVINSGAMQSDPMRLLRDWMALRNRGERLTAVGASDSHDVARFIVGQGRTYIACRDDDPARLDVDAACRALKAGRALVSLGLLARMTVDDRFEVGDLATKLGDVVRVSVEVSGPSWTAADRVELFANGVKIQEARIDPTPEVLKAKVAWTLSRPPHDVSLVAIASGPGVTSPSWAIPRPYQPSSREWTPRVLGFTNPIDLDGDGDGSWTSPRAYAEATIGRVGLIPGVLLPALGPFDEAVAAQAAGLCREAGRDVRDGAFVRQLAAAAEPVRRGFAAFAATLPETAKEGPDRRREGQARLADEPARPAGAVPLRVEVLDAESGRPIPARVYLRGEDGSWHFPVSESPEGSAVPYRKSAFVRPEVVEMHTAVSAHPFVARLAPGRYTFTIERGKEYHPETREVEVGDAPARLTIRLRRWIDMAGLGWYSGDTHVHRPLDELPVAMLAEDLNVAFPLTDWVREAFVPPVERREVGFRDPGPDPIRVDATHLIVPRNTEYEIFTVGKKSHTLGAFFVLNHRTPLDLGVPPVVPVARRAHDEGALIELDKHNWPWSMALVPIMPVDLFELSNNHVWRSEFSYRDFGEPPAEFMQVERDGRGYTERGWLDFGFRNYYLLLDCGFRLRPTAGTASGVHPVPPGFGRVYVRTEGGLDASSWFRGLDAGRSFVTTGPMLFVTLDGREPGHRFTQAASGRREYRLEGSAMSEQPLDRIEVVVNGEVSRTIKPANRRTERGAYESPIEAAVPVEGSSWVAVRCFEARPDGRVRFAHTGPIHIDVPERPLRPRKAEVEYLVRRVEEQIARSAGVLPGSALEEYRQALRIYRKVAETAR